MKIVSVKFVKSYASAASVPKVTQKEIAIVGRSNVGKSSFINYLTNSKIAKTSSTPGKTRLINFFDINDGEFFLVDLPGYGYAKVSKEAQMNWGEEIENYISGSKNIKLILLLVDIRHKPNAFDIQMAHYLNYYKIPYIVIATKADKVSKSQINIQKNMIAATLKLGIDDIYPVSALKRQGAELVLEKLDQFVKGKNK